MLQRLKQPAPMAGILRRRSAHFLTWPPTIPARPHPSSELHAPYGWGDWFIASLVSSVVSWPVAFAVDSFWGSLLLPHVQSIRDGRWVPEAEAASLVPKAFGSYLGAHLFVPRAWWFWKLTLLPALPLSFGISLVIWGATIDGGARREAVEGWAGPEVRTSGAALSVALTLAVALALAVTLAPGPKPTPHLRLPPGAVQRAEGGGAREHGVAHLHPERQERRHAAARGRADRRAVCTPAGRPVAGRSRRLCPVSPTMFRFEFRDEPGLAGK